MSEDTLIPDLTPPTKTEKKAKAAKPKAEKAATAEGGEKKPRAPRQDYGFSKSATLVVAEGAEKKYRGQRGEWFASIQAFNGKTVEEWLESRKEQKDPPRGWLRFFVQDGSVVLVGGEKAAA